MSNVATRIKIISAARTDIDEEARLDNDEVRVDTEWMVSALDVMPASHSGTYLRVANIAQTISPVFITN